MLFREVNERIREINRMFTVTTGSYDVVCECAREECLERIAVPTAVYEDVRIDRLRFVIKPGHEQPGLEEVVADDGGYLVVVPAAPLPPAA